MTEVWKDIEGWEDKYKVSNLGRVFSILNKIYLRPGLVRGRHQVALCRNRKYTFLYVHRLVALAFLKNPNNYPQVNHKNNIGIDNKVLNLEWCTASENIQHAYDNGFTSKVGVLNGRCKLSESDVHEIRSFKKDLTARELSIKYNVSMGAISGIIYNNTWKHI